MLWLFLLNDENDVNDILWERDPHFVVTGVEGERGGNEKLKKVFSFWEKTINNTEHLLVLRYEYGYIGCQFV